MLDGDFTFELLIDFSCSMNRSMLYFLTYAFAWPLSQLFRSGCYFNLFTKYPFTSRSISFNKLIWVNILWFPQQVLNRSCWLSIIFFNLPFFVYPPKIESKPTAAQLKNLMIRGWILHCAMRLKLSWRYSKSAFKIATIQEG